MEHVNTVHEMLVSANQLQQSGCFKEAEELYLRVLKIEPTNFDALHFLGLLCHQIGKHDNAVELLNMSILKNRNNANVFNSLGGVHRDLGHLDKSEICFRQSIALKPDMCEAYSNLGAVLHQCGRLEEAELVYRQALTLKKDWPAVLLSHGNLLMELERFDEAERCYRQVVELEPGNASVFLSLGDCQMKLMRYCDAEDSFRRAKSIVPHNDMVLTGLGNALRALGRFIEAESFFNQAIVLNPGNYAAHQSLGSVCRELGLLQEAEDAYRQALELKPDNSETLCGLGDVLRICGHFEKSEEYYRQVLDRAPDSSAAHAAMGVLFQQIGRFGEAEAAFRKALDSNPVLPACRLRLAILALPAICGEPHNDLCGEFSQKLDELEHFTDQSDSWSALGEAAGTAFLPSYLSCYVGDHLAILSRYGDIICRAGKAWLDRQPAVVEISAPEAPDYVRMVIVVSHLQRHSAWGNTLSGLLRHIDKTRFEIILYHTSPKHDDESSLACNLADRFIQGPADWIAQIRDDAPDVIFYPEIAQDETVIRLATLRCAPLQVAGWECAMTTGLPTMDLFLSGELIEREDADADYREKLVRLPGTGACTTYPEDRTDQPVLLPEESDFPEDRAVTRFVVRQSALHINPSFDNVYPLIAKAAGSSRFWFVLDKQCPRASRAVEERIKNVFENSGLDPVDYLRFIDDMPEDQFGAFLDEMDVYLDTPAYSSFTNALLAVHRGVPVVTLEGRSMRQRLAAGILRRIGVTETIATDVQEYVSRAVTLALNPEERRQAGERLQKTSPQADDDVRVVRAFETSILEALLDHQKKNDLP